MKDTLSVQVTRDSVGYADDVDAPHRIQLAVPADASLAELVGRIRASGFLPIVDGLASWMLKGDRPIARITNKGNQIEFLGGEAKLLREGPSTYHLSYQGSTPK